jgi:hypothetical protein
MDFLLQLPAWRETRFRENLRIWKSRGTNHTLGKVMGLKNVSNVPFRWIILDDIFPVEKISAEVADRSWELAAAESAGRNPGVLPLRALDFVIAPIRRAQ